MTTVIWTRLDTAIVAAVLMMTLGVAGLSVKSGESSAHRIAGNSADFNMADTRLPIAPDSTASLKLSGVSLALR
jgi:hypothetical protein